jgi:hypothetical protein
VDAIAVTMGSFFGFNLRCHYIQIDELKLGKAKKTIVDIVWGFGMVETFISKILREKVASIMIANSIFTRRVITLRQVVGCSLWHQIVQSSFCCFYSIHSVRKVQSLDRMVGKHIAGCIQTKVYL